MTRSATAATARAVGIVAAGALATGLASGLAGQESRVPDGDLPAWDSARALIYDEQVWEPFRVRDADVVPLSRAMDRGVIQPSTPLLILSRPQGDLALSVDQMAYHHAAQGEMAREPWMVSF